MLCLSFLLGESVPPSQSVHTPIEAELLIPISTHTSVGKPVYARVLNDWRGPGCTLRTGGILRGRVVASVLYSKSSKSSSIALAFDSAECADRTETPVALTLVAVLAPGMGSADNDSPPLNEAVGVAIASGSSASSGGGGRSITTAAVTASYQLSRDQRPANITPGAVLGLRGLKLSVGTGPEGSSVLSAAGRDVRLERGSEFYLTVAAPSSAPPVVLASLSAPASTTPPASAPVPQPPAAPTSGTAVTMAAPPDETEICTPPGCSIDLPSAGRAATVQAEATISIGELGYAPRSIREDYGFDHEAAIAYLGPDELLCTFNPHILVPRTPGEPAARLIRAALVDVRTRLVIHTVDWRVPDGSQYLWAVAGDRVLVHVGDQLRAYGPGLKLEHSVPLGAPLAFLKTAPSGRTIVLGLLHERHSPGMHRQLREALGAEPEEDVEVRLFDGHLQPLGSWLHSGSLNAPTLSDGGELRLAVNSRQSRWSIMEYGWNNHRRVVATVMSVCRPDLMSLPPNLLLVSGCARIAGERWYRVLGPDGRAVLRMSSPPSDLARYPCGSEAGQVFALDFAEPARSMIHGSAFSASALIAELVTVYDVHSGRRLLTVRLPDPAATEQTFALSPRGDRLAVLSGNQVSIFDVRAPAGRIHKPAVNAGEQN
jgi:hypothetical protein